MRVGPGRTTAALGLGAGLVLLAAACGVPEHSPQMRPGEDCMGCHGGQNNLRFTAGGTVYRSGDAAGAEGVEGATVVITDKNGVKVELLTNGVGNFYTREALAAPWTVQVRGPSGSNVVTMPTQYEATGRCNDCHSAAGIAGLRIYHPD